MKIIYYSSHATYGAYGMAAIHMGLYKKRELPCLESIIKQWELCLIYGPQLGNLIYMGLDEELREVYILGCSSYGQMIKKTYNGFNELYGIEEDIYFIDAGRWESRIPYLVALSKKHPVMAPIAKRFFLFWFKRKYPIWAENVQEEKEKLGRRIES